MDDVLPKAQPVSYTQEPLRFTGHGGDYFRIWIVNLLLTIVTLGLYSAWAKVRRLQYFYRHTELAGSTFDFHGSPIKILIGRIVALVMFAGYNVMMREHSVWSIAMLAVGAIVLPWLLRNSLRFRLYNTSWRGARFQFQGDVGGAYRVFLLNGILTALTLGGLAPFAHQRLKAYQHGNSRFGRTAFSFHAGVGKFYLAYLLILGAIVAFFIVASLVGAAGLLSKVTSLQQPGGSPANIRAILLVVAVIWGGIVALSLAIGPIFRAVIANLVWSNTRLGEHRIDCHMPPLRLMWITVSNFVLVVVTLGFFMPWAAVRLTRFQLESITLLRAGNLEEFSAADPESIGAIGEEAASIFDVDISL